MILILFLYLNLSMLHLCVSDLGYECKSDEFHSPNGPRIHLINNGGTVFTDQFNYMFGKACESFYDIKEVSLDKYNQKPPTEVNVIHFAVPNYYDGKPLNGFVYAGNITKTADAECRNKTASKLVHSFRSYDATDRNTGIETLKHRLRHQIYNTPLYASEVDNINKDDDDEESELDCNDIVNLVSESAKKLNDGHIYNFVQKMELADWSAGGPKESCKPFLRNVADLTTVLLCAAEKVNVQLTQPVKLKVAEYQCSNSSYLDYVNDHLLAVLAPKPFDVSSEYSVPTIFYETPYMYSKYKSDFPNSMNLIPWQLLKYGFLKFLQAVGWERVVLVTDDSEYSIDFEGELIALFNKEGIIYTVIRCEDANCKMAKINQELHKVKARIVIANVEEDHARYLFENVHGKITWIVRDMPGKKLTKLHRFENVVFSISLRSVDKNKGCDVDDNILTALSNIAQVYKKIPKEDKEEKKRDFYRRFFAEAIDIDITEAIVIVERLRSQGSQNNKISTMYVNATGAELITFTEPFNSGKPSDGTAHCLVKTYDYFDPCEDSLPLLLMCVILLFVTTVLSITCFFDKTSPVNDIRYQHF